MSIYAGTGLRPGADTLIVREPRVEDGADVWRMIRAAPELDNNSLYCNLLQCSHFAGTCALAESHGEVVGWVSGYMPPRRQDTLFIWQICVASAARGRGVAGELIADVLRRPACGQIRHLECTITPDNRASRAFFSRLARELNAPVQERAMFARDQHFDGLHDSEFAVRIGPFQRETADFLAA